MEKRENPSRASIVYLSHGAGPMPILGGMGHEAMISFTKGLGSIVLRPDEILVISAHWEERVPTVIDAASPSLYYDYYGFPDAAYAIQYPAPGDPELATEIVELLGAKGIEASTDSKRGLDHGVFIPLALMYPNGDIPITQLSLVRGLDPGEHLAMAKALRPLLARNILVIGSGFSFHNMSAFSLDPSNADDPANNAFQDWLIDTCCGNHKESVRDQRLVAWANAPHARYCHPREEHLMPLHVCQGLAGKSGKVIFDDYIAGKRSVAIRW